MRRTVLQGLSCILLLICLQLPMEVQAAEERIEFGSEAYRWELGEEHPIGIHFYAYYEVEFIEFEIFYNERMLEHISGGELVEPGVVRIQSESPFSGAFSNMLYFAPLIGGRTSIAVRNINVHAQGGEVIQLERIRVYAHLEAPEEAGLRLITINGQEIEGFSYDVFNYDFEVEYEVEAIEIIATPMDENSEPRVINRELEVGVNRVTIITDHWPYGSVRYILYITRNQQDGYYVEEGEGEEIEAEEEVQEVIIPEPQVIHIADGDIGILGNPMLLAVVLLLQILLLCYLIYEKIRIEKRRKWREKVARHNARRRERERERRRGEVFDDFDGIDDFRLIDDRKVEIRVKGITMDYKQEQDEAGSLKELVLKIIKRNRKVKLLRALDNITFNVKKGEVLGIVGTNGSGKSTLLKIISGVLPPTYGEVEVDRSKVQLLTLGTGFDAELTGRENVYLNGALIGYSKDYIDERYDEIVAFAELEGFMEEKVKTYSSGMVSRLGFAIATAREAPGILILDEVLSVGDMHFARKSKAKIKELIHSGSTVLIVSHSPAAIRENCTSAIWIEKSRLMLQGDVDYVCKAYEGKAV